MRWVLVLAITACTPPPSPRGPVQLSLQLATRQSCGIASGLDYDTSCMAAVDVRVLDAATRQLIADQCSPVDGAAGSTLGALLEGNALLKIAKLSASRSVIFQVRGLHDKTADAGPAVDASALCAGDAGHGQWLFWGESLPIDLTKYDGAQPDPDRIVRIVIDCRDCTFGASSDCGGDSCFGCGGIDEGTCPASLPTSFCIPTVQCDKFCNSDDDCFDKALPCVDHKCNSTQHITGELCSPCGNGVGCADNGYDCVKRASGGPSFCANVCPGESDQVCAEGTKCNRLGNDLVRVP